MNKSLLSSAFAVGVLALALAMALQIPAVEAAVTTTIIGWNVPNGSTFGNGLGALVFPLVGVGLFAGIPLAFGYKGDFAVTMAMLGLLVGSVFGTLSLTASNPTIEPFGMIVLSGFLLSIWMWKGAKG